MKKQTTRLGVVTTGHGPREEYVEFHRRLLAALGADVTVFVRHIYEGLTLGDLDPHEVGKETANIGAHVHVTGAVGNHMGDGWEHRFYALDFATARVQQTIDLLEKEDAVDMVLLACAAEFPPGSLIAETILIHPRELLFQAAENLTRGARRRIRLGVIVDAQHADHDLADWQKQPWFDRIDLVVSPIDSDTLSAARKLGEAGVEFAFLFGYGVGLAPLDPRDQVAQLEAAIGAPLILPHRVATLFLRNLIGPPLDDHAYLPDGWGPK